MDKLIRVDQRLVTLTIPPQELITRDNVPARVNAVVMFSVVDPLKAILAVENYAVATSRRPQQRFARHHRGDDRTVGRAGSGR